MRLIKKRPRVNKTYCETTIFIKNNCGVDIILCEPDLLKTFVIIYRHSSCCDKGQWPARARMRLTQ